MICQNLNGSLCHLKGVKCYRLVSESIVCQQYAGDEQKHTNKQKIEYDGYTFDSVLELRYYKDLKIRVLAREITGLKMQVEYILQDKPKLKYTSDFEYDEKGVHHIVEIKPKTSKGWLRARDAIRSLKILKNQYPESKIIITDGVTIRDVK